MLASGHIGPPLQADLFGASMLFWLVCRGDPMWSPVNPSILICSVKQTDKPKFEHFAIA